MATLGEVLQNLTIPINKNLLPALRDLRETGGSTAEQAQGINVLEQVLTNFSKNPRDYKITFARIADINASNTGTENLVVIGPKNPNYPQTRFAFVVNHPTSSDVTSANTYAEAVKPKARTDRIAIKNADRKVFQPSILVHPLTATMVNYSPRYDSLRRDEFIENMSGMLLTPNCGSNTVTAERADRRGRRILADISSATDIVTVRRADFEKLDTTVRDLILLQRARR